MDRIEAGRLIPGRGDAIDGGVVVIDGGAITYAGAAAGAPATEETTLVTVEPTASRADERGLSGAIACPFWTGRFMSLHKGGCMEVVACRVLPGEW